MAYRSLLGSTLLFAMGLVTAPSLSAQAPPESSQEPVSGGVTLKAESRVVVVDVVVTDKQGKSVSGLSRADFQLLEDGTPQNITGFEEHKSANATKTSLPPMGPNVFTNFPTTLDSGTVNVLLIDTLNTQPQDQAVIRESVNKFLTNVPQGTRMAVFVLGDDLRMVRGFTSDFSGLAEALDRKSVAAPTDLQRNMPTEAEVNSEIKTLEQMAKSQASQIAIDALSNFQEQQRASATRSRADVTLQAFQHIARYLASIPARKNVIWLSDSFPVSFFPDERSRATKNANQVKATSDVLTAAQVAIYPVSALGLATDPTYNASKLGGTRQQLEQRLSADKIAMQTIAEETGGRAFSNTNALAEAVQDAVNNGSRYYTISYSPVNATFDGKFRKIEVTTSRSGSELSYRRGYYADAATSFKASQESPDDPFLPLMGFGMPNFDQILYKIHVAKKVPQPATNAPRAGVNTSLKAPLFRYSVDFAAALQDLSLFQNKDGSRSGQIEVVMIAFDSNGKILNMVRKRNKLLLPPEVYAATLPVGMQIHEEIDVPVGEVYLRAGIYDSISGKCGTLGIPLARLAEGQSSLK